MYTGVWLISLGRSTTRLLVLVCFSAGIDMGDLDAVFMQDVGEGRFQLEESATMPLGSQPFEEFVDCASDWLREWLVTLITPRLCLLKLNHM